MKFKPLRPEENDHAPPGSASTFDKGPHGLGDPTNQTLSAMEKYTVLPVVKKKILIEGKCAQLWQALLNCKSEHNIIMQSARCSGQKRDVQNCIEKESKDAEVCKITEQVYLEERTLLRLTGKTREQREYLATHGTNKPAWYNVFAFRKHSSDGEKLPWRDELSRKYEKFKESVWGKKTDENSTHTEDITNK